MEVNGVILELFNFFKALMTKLTIFTHFLLYKLFLKHSNKITDKKHSNQNFIYQKIYKNVRTSDNHTRHNILWYNNI